MIIEIVSALMICFLGLVGAFILTYIDKKDKGETLLFNIRKSKNQKFINI